mmetsp:Transcript_61383/g.121517  ORF Transcript_61383/g.121517 Transcript_61383/m.121517 type:complete len:511 (+) Transcript_61383:80-1612(+)
MTPPRRSIASLAASVAVVSSFLFGYSICVLDSCGELVSVVFEWCGNDWQSDCFWSRALQGLINAALYLGAAAGSLMVGMPQISSRGSRFQLIVADSLFILGAATGASAQGFLSLFFSRLISGAGLGISAIAAPLYLAEISPREHRGFNSAMHGVFIAVGILAAIVLGIPQSPPPSRPGAVMKELDLWYWRVLLGIPLIIALFQAVLFLRKIVVDPPSFLVLQGRMPEARSLLYRSYGAEEPQDHQCNGGSGRIEELEGQLAELQLAATSFKSTPRIYIHQAISDPFLRHGLFVGFGLAAFQQLCGINSLMSYSNSLFSEAGIPPQSLTIASTIMAATNVCFSFLSSQLVDHWGRRSLLLAGPFIQVLAMAGMHFVVAHLPAQYVGIGTVGCFSLFVVSFSLGLGAVTWLYLAEIYPMEIRGAALSACGVINWLSCFAVVFGGRFFSLHTACQVFGIITTLGLFGVLLWVIETKGCSMDDSPLTPLSGRSTSPLLTPLSGQDIDEDDQLSD